MEALFVFYDGECGLCSKARTHLAGMAQHVPLIFVSYQDLRLQAVFPEVELLDPDQQVIAMSDTGDIYRGDSAWITILWALRDYRRWAFLLARSAWRHQAKAAVHYLSLTRRRLSAGLGLRVRSTFPD